jgi:hypothetical protein
MRSVRSVHAYGRTSGASSTETTERTDSSSRAKPRGRAAMNSSARAMWRCFCCRSACRSACWMLSNTSTIGSNFRIVHAGVTKNATMYQAPLPLCSQQSRSFSKNVIAITEALDCLHGENYQMNAEWFALSAGPADERDFGQPTPTHLRPTPHLQELSPPCLSDSNSAAPSGMFAM